MMSKVEEETNKMYQIRYGGGNAQEQEQRIGELKRKLEEKQSEVQEQRKRMEELDGELHALMEEIRR